MKTDSSNFKVDADTYQNITKVILRRMRRLHFGVLDNRDHDQTYEMLESEYKECTDEIFKLLGGKIEQ